MTNQPGFVVFAYLRKSLPFAAQFDVLDQPLSFPRGDSGRPVASFGKLGSSSSPSDERLAQVQVHAYESDDDFVIELRSTAKNDTLLLAKIPPQGTLQETIDAVMTRSRKPKPRGHRSQLEEYEDLNIPKLSLNVLHEFGELQALRLPDFDARFRGLPATIQDVSQGIVFVLSERGAEEESFAEIVVIGSDGDDSERKLRRRFVFDRPFLVLLSERDAAEPYFALWVENTELMEIAR